MVLEIFYKKGLKMYTECPPHLKHTRTSFSQNPLDNQGNQALEMLKSYPMNLKLFFTYLFLFIVFFNGSGKCHIGFNV